MARHGHPACPGSSYFLGSGPVQSQRVEMIADKYPDFLAGDDTLHVYMGDMLVFSSKKDRLLPLMDYIEGYGPMCQEVVIFDKVMGNAAALLVVKVNCREVHSPLGSELAVKTLDKFKIRRYLGATVPFI